MVKLPGSVTFSELIVELPLGVSFRISSQNSDVPGATTTPWTTLMLNCLVGCAASAASENDASMSPDTKTIALRTMFFIDPPKSVEAVLFAASRDLRSAHLRSPPKKPTRRRGLFARTGPNANDCESSYGLVR